MPRTRYVEAVKREVHPITELARQKSQLLQHIFEEAVDFRYIVPTC